MNTIYIEEHKGLNIFQLPYLDDAKVYEVRPGIGEKPKAYCTKCKVNWACLYTINDFENDESYDVCPACASDAYLEDYHHHEDGFIHSPITGELRNIATGKPEVKQPDYSDEPFTESPKFDREVYEASKEKEQELHDLAIEEYQQVFALDGHEKAEQAFFNKIQQLKSKP